MSEPEREYMDHKLLKALRRGNKKVVTTFFPQDTESPDSDIEVAATADNAADQARGTSRRGVTAGGNSALHAAATFGHSKLAKLIICDRDRSLLESRNAAGETPLHCAARAGADRIVGIFISEASQRQRLEAVLRATDREGKTALHAAVEGGHAAAAGALVSADRGLAAMVDDNGVSPLYAAVLLKSLKVVQILTKSHADGGDAPEASDAGPNGQTALHAAAMIESPEIAKKLLQWKPTIAEKADNSGSTPLHYLATTSNTNMVRELLHHKPSVAYHSDFEGLYPIHVAARMGRLGVVRKLVESCPDVDEFVDNKRRNFLHVAVVHGREKLVKFVCQRPSLVRMMNARDCEGNTPLHLAVVSKNEGIVGRLLGNCRVHPSIANNDGRTPLDLAVPWLEEDFFLHNLNKSTWIYHCLKAVGAVGGPRRLDRLIDENLTELELEKELKKYKDVSKNLVIVSVVIATVTFIAAFAMLRGHIYDLPTTAEKYAFKFFIAADTTAFAFSVTAALQVMYAGSQASDPSRWVEFIVRTRDLITTAARLTVVAFGSSLYVLLAPRNVPLTVYCSALPFVSPLIFDFPNPKGRQFLPLAKVLMRRMGWSGMFIPCIVGRPCGFGMLKYYCRLLWPSTVLPLAYANVFLLPLLPSST